MRPSRLLALAFVALLHTDSTLCRAQGDFTPPAPQAINTAIDNGVAWLKQAQRKDGSWGSCIGGQSYDGGPGGVCFPIGPTAFSTFTLLECDVPPKDPVIRKALKWLKKTARRCRGHTRKSGDYQYTSYESAAVVLMLTALHQRRREPGARTTFPRPSDSPLRPPKGSRFTKDHWKWLRERVDQIAWCQRRLGVWGYYAYGDLHDVSATQFAVLALREARRAGYPVTRQRPYTWKLALDGLQTFQLPSGAFHYREGYPWTAGITAAGVSSLLICKEQIHLAGQEAPAWLQPAITKGLSFMGQAFDVRQNTIDPAKPKHRWASLYHYCHLYAIERVGALSGKREFGSKTWYPRGAAFLLREQRKDGSWRDYTCMRPKDVLGTCFALLFLKRATPPTVTIPTRR